MASTSNGEASHPVVFTTQTPYPLPSQKFMIPTSWRRYQLSQLVNKALSLPNPIPFDFLVRGEILRGTLEEWCKEKGLGEEETLEIEYFESVMPPQKMASLPHEDWVSSVSSQIPEHLLTASYDGQIRTFDYSQKLRYEAVVHSAPITSICVIPSSQDSYIIGSASHDLTARLTQLSLGDEPSARTLASLHLHTAPLSSIASNFSGKHLLTASWDSLIGLWDTSIPSSDEVPDTQPASSEVGRKKRRKLDDAERPVRKAPLSVLKSHTARVSRAVFAPASSNIAYSCGLDSTIRTWDVENSVCTNTITASAKPFLDLALTSAGNTALAASTDRTVSAYDLRAAESTTSTAFASFVHPSTPSYIATPSSTSSSSSSAENQFVTGAYDGVVRLWDLRSVRSAVVSFKAWDGAGNQVLGVDWRDGVVCIGGKGGMEVWRMNQGDRPAAA